MNNLQSALKYLEDLISLRLNQGKQGDPLTLPDFGLSEEEDAFSQLSVGLDLSLEEFLLLLIALVPHIYPDFFDRVVAKHLEEDSDLPAFGGIKTSEQRTMMPTVSTALFVLAGEDMQKRMELLSLFDNRHALYQHSILSIESPKTGESILNRRILLEPEYIELFTQGYISPPKFSSSFPASLLQTQQEWKDLVLPAHVMERIEEIKAWVEHSNTLMKDWGLERILKPGFRALFHGPPGTGKTLTASLLGKYTEKQVFRIDLSAVVSKFIGETEKNLSQLFDKAENKNWILFFDEADALFGKRTNVKDAHDRYANQEVSYLLQRVEEFPGLIILASNLKSNLDDAFLRRFQSIIYFPMPASEQRLKIWQKAFPENLYLEDQLDLEEIAQRYELAGGSIINVIQYACLKSAQRKATTIRLQDVLNGIRREIEKEGKLFKGLK